MNLIAIPPALILLLGVAAGSLPVTPAPAAAPSERSLRSALPDFTPLVRQHGAAIVSINSQRSRGGSIGHGSEALGELLRRFGLADPNDSTSGNTLGSGFIIDAEGHILSSAHLVDGADVVTVGLTDQRQFPATVIGVDRTTDIALLKINAPRLTHVSLGDPANLEVGEWVVAIGAPFGFTNSVTQGIVSAKGRELPGNGVTPYLQTDVAINPGNSGGPLFNLRGEVVGINAQILSSQRGPQGISFAVPIDVAIRVKDELIRHGSVRRAQSGFTVQDVSPGLAASFRLPQPRGALINTVEHGGAGEVAGLHPGDVVLEFNGQPIGRAVDLNRRIAEARPGTRVALRYWRDGSAQEVHLRLGREGSPVKLPRNNRLAVNELGVVLLELGRADRFSLGTEGVVMIEAVDGIAARAGLQPGDMLLAVNQTRVGSLADIRPSLSGRQKHIALLIEREPNASVFVPLALD